ncbi:MAG: aspartate carbamoyltransferase catalytic subunit [Devosia sp.]|jgi:aspartate carbamoyltransferase catalytic subunit|uniref:aspartate carbamoyltransferase catalytic subunit n=1 Tax=unclassified Devosia TaxID=196773 RepID=UPI0019E3B41A|nr:MULTISPECIES: aspartate carbamoyltransferase catalytic subunit [unclassified Devosia]MBF0678349.1 aspartate carbamoyltransferase catalytic subunit [Devosia sp.]WEJ31599.1 aspartate carbamoyltransferase catalytic subunit [Devosia sp. SD17-2]
MAQIPASNTSSSTGSSGDFPPFSQRHLISIADLKQHEIIDLLDRAERMVPVSRQERKSLPTLAGKTQINLFFEPSTRTQSSFEIAGKRLGAMVVNMSVKTSSVSKGETLVDTAATLNAMRPDVLIVRHAAAGAVELLSQKVGCSVVNAGDGAHEHPTQALLDALTIRRHKGRISGLTVAICGDIANSRVARSNLLLLQALNVRTRVIAPKNLLPSGIEHLATEVFTDMEAGLKDVDVVMMLRLQHERANGKMIPSVREYYRFYGLDAAKLAFAKPDAIVMHPGPMNRGVEIDPAIADGARSVITEQVEMGVAVRMAVLDALLSGDQS